MKDLTLRDEPKNREAEEIEFPSHNIVFELAKEKLHLQSEQWNAIDSKNAIVLAVYGVILAIFLGQGDKALIIHDKFISFIWLGSIAGGMLCSIISLFPRDIISGESRPRRKS